MYFPYFHISLFRILPTRIGGLSGIVIDLCMKRKEKMNVGYALRNIDILMGLHAQLPAGMVFYILNNLRRKAISATPFRL